MVKIVFFYIGCFYGRAYLKSCLPFYQFSVFLPVLYFNCVCPTRLFNFHFFFSKSMNKHAKPIIIKHYKQR